MTGSLITALAVVQAALSSAGVQASPEPVRVMRGSKMPSFAIDKPEASAGACLPNARLGDARVAVLGAYEGGVPTRYAVADASSDVAAIGVTASRGGPPVLLVLTAYDPVIWDLATFPKARLRGVVVYGYHGQAVANLDTRIPVAFTDHASGQGACGKALYAYKGGRGLEQLAAQLDAVFGKPIATFQGAYGPSGFNLDEGVLPQASGVFRSAAIRSRTPIKTDAVSPKEQGLVELVNQGAIRPATSADVNRFNAAMTRASPTGHLAPVRAENLGAGRAFVVLRRTILPRGMYGAHSRSFIIPEGVDAPMDPGSHNSFYFIKDGSCMGAIC